MLLQKHFVILHLLVEFAQDNNIEDYIKIFNQLDSLDVTSLQAKTFEFVNSHFSIQKMQEGYESLFDK